MRISKIKDIKVGISQITTNKIRLSTKLININNDNLVNKICPHCNNNSLISKDSNYNICGYLNDTDVIWVGCGKDWCGKCNKMLCKSWDKDNLKDLNNRIHNEECCIKYAKENNIDLELMCNCVF
jgi:hypothetical protein